MVELPEHLQNSRSAYRIGGREFIVRLFAEAGSQRKSCERELLATGRPLSLSSRHEWGAAGFADASWFVGVSSENGVWESGLGLSVYRSRALPGHLILRAERVLPSTNSGAQSAAIRGLADLGREHPRVLRVDFEVFSCDPEARSRIGESAQQSGFRRRKRCRSYTRTVAVDLRGTESEVLASLHATARRHIRAVDKNPVVVRPVSDVQWAGRLDELVRETMARTGGRPQPKDWPRLIGFCTRHPDLARLVGLFQSGVSGPNALLAFALCFFHGDHAQYDTAASTKESSLKMPLAYGVVWDLMRWARSQGATWFDFGGITVGTQGDPDDPLGGISDFKRYFSRDVVEVGEEWVFEPRRLRAGLARGIGTGAALLSGIRRSVVRRFRQARFGGVAPAQQSILHASDFATSLCWAAGSARCEYCVKAHPQTPRIKGGSACTYSDWATTWTAAAPYWKMAGS